MSQQAAQQIQAIHAMLSIGQRNLRMEKHSFWLWGLSGGLLFAVSDNVLTQTQIPNTTTRAFAWLALLVLVFASVGFLDWHFTRQVKAARDEVWSFIHRQLMKIWWMLIAIGVLLTFAFFFFGGGYMVCSAWIVLIGLGLFIHGLFSDESLEWAGGMMLLVGILTLSFNFPYPTMKWIAASMLGLGMPLLTALLYVQRPVWLKWSLLLAWAVMVLLPPLLMVRYVDAQAPMGNVVSLAQFKQQRSVPAQQIVAIPKGTLIPVSIALSGDVFEPEPHLTLSMRLKQSIEIVMEQGHPTRKVRLERQDWLASSTAGWVSIPWIRGEMTLGQGPQVYTDLIVNLQHP